jgi:hypothetical protein
LGETDHAVLHRRRRLQQSIHFELETVFAGVEGITILHRRASRQRAAEVLLFDEHGKVVRGVAHHDIM